MVLSAIRLLLRFCPAKGVCRWKATPGRPLFVNWLSMTTLPAVSNPPPATKRPTPAPAPRTATPLPDDWFPEIVLLSTARVGGISGGRFGSSGCDASVMPQSNGLFWAMLPMIRLSWVAPVSSLSRIPPADDDVLGIGSRRDL